jgi:AraC-like DNA-binding protein
MDDSRVETLPMTAAYFRLIARRFGSTAARRAALREDASVAGAGSHGRARVAALDDEITVGAQLRQLAKLHAFARPGWGLELGAALDGVTHGPAGAVAVTAPSLGAALTALARYAPVRTPFIDLRATRAARRYELRIVETCRLGAVRTAVLEMVLLSIQGVVEAALGRRMDAATFFMPAPRPAHWRRYADHFHAPVRFAGNAARVELPAAWLELPCPLADRVAHRDACARLEALRERLTGDFADAQVERALGDGDTRPTLGAVARRLRLSPRTLVRRLGERGTSFRALLEEQRRARAGELLLRSQLSVAEIAERLGYEDPTNFARACRRWFGLSPRAYRARDAMTRVAAGGGLG